MSLPIPGGPETAGSHVGPHARPHVVHARLDAVLVATAQECETPEAASALLRELPETSRPLVLRHLPPGALCPELEQAWCRDPGPADPAVAALWARPDLPDVRALWPGGQPATLYTIVTPRIVAGP